MGLVRRNSSRGRRNSKSVLPLLVADCSGNRWMGVRVGGDPRISWAGLSNGYDEHSMVRGARGCEDEFDTETGGGRASAVRWVGSRASFCRSLWAGGAVGVVLVAGRVNG